ncbi:TAXI family TRAP transporter solute-binding subunit [Desulforhopalus sp. IMCC35007]|uniref:TAXI family TRAP transporter solute-binding subunit n=1 Tax=Desulforhopalus sp. IMCC35007 TaxID=2569543 RepID=UPI0010AE36C1|nr:TAXI family TRAP transporter solute-binding subunit [Desulforhopalus sp. IMCC35007]TKB06693.1 TAXI family TRAP transporter solute-binding subunit [Desulforhopalus sp. IMCC35007]
MKKCFAILLLMLGTTSSWATGTVDIGKDLFVTVATGGTSGVYYPIGGAVANVLSSELGIDTSVQATGASVENINLLKAGKAEIAIVMADAVAQAYDGSGAFEGKEPIKNLRGLTALYPNFVQVVTTSKTGITSIKDLAGKHVGVGAPGSGVELNARLILEAYGLSYDDIKQDYLSYSEAIDQIKNGMIDAAFVTSGVPNSTVIDLSVSHDTIVLPIDGEAMAYLKEKYPFFSSGTIPGGTYRQKEDVKTATITNLLLISDSLSEDAAYQITKALFENLETLYGAHNAAKNISLPTVADGMPIPFHPGTEKYFKEVGALK